jgi:hypothetical protein
VEKNLPMTESSFQTTYRLKFQIGDWTLFSVGIPVYVRQLSVSEAMADPDAQIQPTAPLPSDCKGFLFRGIPDKNEGPEFYAEGDYLCYVMSRAPRYFIEFGDSFDDYAKSNFSSKSRSTILRKVKKFAKHSGGELNWASYRTPDEMMEFHRQAREVAAHTYQEKLFDGALPGDADFIEQMCREAAADSVRAYLLFHDGKAVSYLYLRSSDGTLTYDYLGYLPDYGRWSVGTVLQWVALEALFAEKKFRLFDLTEGDGSHKRLFATNNVSIANVIYLRKNLNNRLLIMAHRWCDGFSVRTGQMLENWGIKKTIKNFLRFGVRRPWRQPS